MAYIRAEKIFKNKKSFEVLMLWVESVAIRRKKGSVNSWYL